jgi:hypothetical protein
MLKNSLGVQRFRNECDIFDILIQQIVNKNKKNCCITSWATVIYKVILPLCMAVKRVLLCGMDNNCSV